jgi:hypothetical protein
VKSSVRTYVRAGRLTREITLPKGPKGAEFPSQVAWRQGVTEVRVPKDGRAQFGRDLSEAVTNDPKAKPWDSVVAEQYGPNKLNRRLNLGAVDMHLEGRKLRFTEAPPAIKSDHVRRRRRPLYD